MKRAKKKLKLNFNECLITYADFRELGSRYGHVVFHAKALKLMTFIESADLQFPIIPSFIHIIKIY